MSTMTRLNLDGDHYLELVRRFPLRPLRSDAELDGAIEMVDELVSRIARLTPGERDYLDVLSDIVEKYEGSQFPIRPATDSEMLRFLIEAREGLTQSRLAEETGIALSTISSVLSGKRRLNRAHIGILSSYFAVSPTVFLFE